MKNTLLIFALLWALGASGQIYIDSYRFGAAPAVNLLLDDYPNAAAAYSLRKLRTAYTGDCIVVRRSSNNDTLAIGFSGNYLDTAALKTFCASTDCFVRTWYDQSGNNLNVTQTTNTAQPQIITSGALYYENNKPALSLSGNRFLVNSTDTLLLNVTLGDFSFFTVHKTPASPSVVIALNWNGSSRFSFFPNVTATTTGARVFWDNIGTSQETPSVNINNINVVYSMIYDRNGTSNNYSVYRNNSLVISFSSTGTSLGGNNAFQIGAANIPSSLFLNTRFQELVVYRIYQSTNRTGIESNINSFYNIY